MNLATENLICSKFFVYVARGSGEDPQKVHLHEQEYLKNSPPPGPLPLPAEDPTNPNLYGGPGYAFATSFRDALNAAKPGGGSSDEVLFQADAYPATPP